MRIAARLLWVLPPVAAGCTLTAPRVTKETYRAIGTEPFWSIAIADGNMRYEDVERRTVEVPTPAPRVRIDGHSYVTSRLTVEVTRTACSDGMSDRRYPDTVRVLIDGRELHGCGGIGPIEARQAS
jgi:heat shock protein HslJ